MSFVLIWGVFYTLFLYYIDISSFNIKILLENDKIIFYKNNKISQEIFYSSIEQLTSGDINHHRKIPKIVFHLNNNKKYTILINISGKENRLHSDEIHRLIRYFIQRHNFKKKPLYTKLGKAKYMFIYVNPNYLKDK